MDIIYVILTLIALVAALEPAHRRTLGLSRAPWGADTTTDRDAARIREDLRSAALAPDPAAAGRPVSQVVGAHHKPIAH